MVSLDTDLFICTVSYLNVTGAEMIKPGYVVSICFRCSRNIVRFRYGPYWSEHVNNIFVNCSRCSKRDNRI